MKSQNNFLLREYLDLLELCQFWRLDIPFFYLESIPSNKCWRLCCAGKVPRFRTSSCESRAKENNSKYFLVTFKSRPLPIPSSIIQVLKVGQFIKCKSIHKNCRQFKYFNLLEHQANQCCFSLFFRFCFKSSFQFLDHDLSFYSTICIIL